MSLIIRDRREKRTAHGYVVVDGKRDYIPGPYHGRLSNLDYAEFAEQGKNLCVMARHYAK